MRGRLQVVAEDPLTVLDGAHNPDAARALVRVADGCGQGRRCRWSWGCSRTRTPRVCSPCCCRCATRAWFTAPPSSRALSPAALQSLARQLGFEETECEPNPRRALALAQGWARAQPGEGAVLATGSIYLVGDLLAETGMLVDSGMRAKRVSPESVEGECLPASADLAEREAAKGDAAGERA